VVVRIWRTALDESRAGEYERFARERSLPMFQQQQGCLGVLFARTEQARAVITLWEDEAAAHRLESDPGYRATVEGITATGFLRPPQVVEIFEVGEGWLNERAAGRLLDDDERRSPASDPWTRP
jgi:heme-degrading monooxygenase HmoA